MSRRWRSALMAASLAAGLLQPAHAASARVKPRPASPAAAPVAAAPTAPVAPAADPVQAEAERQLQSIRHALLESSLAAPVRVQSFAWIDTEGRLHESTQFTSDTRVRGVRLPSYVEDPAARAAAPRPVVDASVLPAGVGPRAEADPQRCMAQGRRWRQALHVEAVAEAALPPALARQAQQDFLAAARDSRRWLAQPRPYQGATAYERALVGREADQSEWLARIALSPVPGGLQARVELDSLLRPGESRRVELRLADASPQALAEGMAQAVADLERRSACEPVGFTVSTGADGLRLREGLAHGLRPGDRLLLVQRQHLPARLLEPGAVRALAMVQVAASGPNGASLRWLAGPRPAGEGTALPASPADWVALPL